MTQMTFTCLQLTIEILEQGGQGMGRGDSVPS